MKKVSRAEVAKAANVAESTVSRALNDSPLITADVKKRVKAVAAQLGYIPNKQAVLLASKRTMRIGFVVKTYKAFSPFSRSYFPRLLDGILYKAEELGYSITIVLDKKNDTYKDLSQLVFGKEVDGLIFSVTPLNDPRFEQLLQKSIPFVLINNYYEKADSINCNPYKGTNDAIAHLKALGHTHIGYISGDQYYWDGRERLKVFNKLTKEHNFKTTVVEGNFSKRSGISGTEKLLSIRKPPSVIMAASDRCALGVLEYCRKENIRVPDELSIIGFDNLGPARDSIPGLSTIHNPVARMGSEAIAQLDNRLSGREKDHNSIFLDSGYIIRETTGVPRE